MVVAKNQEKHSCHLIENVQRAPIGKFLRGRVTLLGKIRKSFRSYYFAIT